MKIPKIRSLLGPAVAIGVMAGSFITQATVNFLSCSPSGKVQMENNIANFSFSLSDTVPVTNIQVILTGTRLVGGSLMRFGGTNQGLTISPVTTGVTTTYNCTFTGYKLQSNMTYAAQIIANEAGAVSYTYTNFDTVKPAYYWEAEDFDYTLTNADGTFYADANGITNNGHYEAGILSSNKAGTVVVWKTNGFRGQRASVLDARQLSTTADALSAAKQIYRPFTTVLGFTNTGWGVDPITNIGWVANSAGGQTERPNPRYATSNGPLAGVTNYALGYSTTGNYANYTRPDWPTSQNYWYVFARFDTPNTSTNDSLDMYDQNGFQVGMFLIPTATGDWQKGAWYPLVDTVAQTIFPISTINNLNPQTFSVKIPANGAGFNLDSFMLISAADNQAPTPSATISGFSPDGTYQFQSSNTLTFKVTGGGVTQNGIMIQLYATNVDLTITTNFYVGTAGGKVTIAGTVGNWTVTVPLTPNKMYKATVQATDSSGSDAIVTSRFDTFAPAGLVEFEDFDFNGGQYTNGVGAYSTVTSISGVDFNWTGTGTNFYYRPNGLDTELCSETISRANHTNAAGAYVQDYDIGGPEAVGTWANYTRAFPVNMSGTTNVGYNIMVRAAGPGNSTDFGSLWTVTSGVGSSNQTLEKIGQFNVIGNGTSSDWHTGTWAPLIDPGGNLAIFRGGPQTVQYQFDTANYANPNYFMLIPADPNVKNKPYISSFTPDGTKLFQPSNTIHFFAVSQAGISPAGISVTLDGAIVSTNQYTLGTNQYRLSVDVPLNTNTLHTVGVRVTDAFGSSSNGYSTFGAFSPTNAYVIQQEDWDFNGGKWVDWTNYYPDCYSNYAYSTPSISNVDFIRLGTGGSMVYRYGGETETATENLLPPGWSNQVNYATGYSTTGEWWNFTRRYPQGIYNVFKRACYGAYSGTAAGGAMSQVVSNLGQVDSSQVKVALGNFGTYNNTGGTWTTFTWSPLTDSSGNLVKIFSDGSNTVTLRDTVNGGVNSDYYLVVPWNTNIADKPKVVDYWPDPKVLYPPTNLVSFRAISGDPSFSIANVTVNLDGINLATSMLSNSVYVGGTTNGLTPRGLNVGFYASAGRLHTVIITVADKVGTFSVTNYAALFDTNMVKIESEDWDYNKGQFVTLGNWTPNCYVDTPTQYAYTNIDFWKGGGNTGGTMSYRYGIPTGTTVWTAESAGFYNADGSQGLVTNWVLSYNDPSGEWANYTRDIPVGTYNIYTRLSTGASVNSVVSGGSFSIVTNGLGSTNQSTNFLGNFAAIVSWSANWGDYHWIPLVDANSNVLAVTITNTTPTTFKYSLTAAINTLNIDYFVLVPADTTTPVIAGLYPDGSTAFQSTNRASFNVGSSAGIHTNNILVTLNGVAVGFSATGNSTNWTISVPLSLNTNYTLKVSVTADNNAGSAKSATFDTFSAFYQFEAEDFDYSSNNTTGLYFDYPAVCAYINTYSQVGYDFYLPNTQNETPTAYRVYTNGSWVAGLWWPASFAANDTARSQFSGTAATNTDYDIQDVCATSWAHYSRHYPAGTYNVVARLRAGNGPVPVSLSLVNGALLGVNGESLTTLGTFYPTNQGSFSGPWQTSWLVNSNGGLATVTFDGSLATLRWDALTNSPNPGFSWSYDSINMNYFMLVPVTSTNVPTPTPKVTATLSGGIVTLSFPSQSGFNYQVQSTPALATTGVSTWTAVGSAQAGTGQTLSVPDSASATTRYYRVLVTKQ